MLNLVLRPFRSRGKRYTPGDFVESPGDVLSFRSRVTAGEIYVVKELDEPTKGFLKAYSARINIDLVDIVSQELLKQQPVTLQSTEKAVKPEEKVVESAPKVAPKAIPVVKLK